jgi:hypothetical protein
VSEQPPPPVQPSEPPAEPPEQPAEQAPEPPQSHPVRLIVNDDCKRSRLTVFFRLLLLIPHLVWMYFWSSAVAICMIVNWFAVLIKGQSPEDLHHFLVRALRYRTHVTSYAALVSNPYPTFFGRPGSHPVDLEVDGPSRQPRLVTFFRLIVALPALVVAYVFYIVMFVIALVGWFICIVLGRMPKGMRDVSAYCLRYETQTTAYLLVLTSRYPSFAGPRT